MKHRNAIEGTQSELVRAHGLRHARYRGLAKVCLQDYFIGARLQGVVVLADDQRAVTLIRAQASVASGPIVTGERLREEPWRSIPSRRTRHDQFF